MSEPAAASSICWVMRRAPASSAPRNTPGCRFTQRLRESTDASSTTMTIKLTPRTASSAMSIPHDYTQVPYPGQRCGHVDDRGGRTTLASVRALARAESRPR